MTADMPSREDQGAPREWFTVEQAADWLQVSTKTIRRYIETGSLPAVNLGGRAIRIRRQDLENWLQGRRIEPGTRLGRMARFRHRPRYADADDLAQVGVSIAQNQPLQFRCDTCGTVWSPVVRRNGRLGHDAWRCPNGCNSGQ